MELTTAISLVEAALEPQHQTWADLGAGTGLFTEALLQTLPESAQVHALDKSPRYLYDLWRSHRKRLIVHDGDFTQEMELPPQDGVLMANALHYVQDKQRFLPHIFSYLKPGGTFLLVEYETDRPQPPWVPYPLSFATFKDLATELGLTDIQKLHQVSSAYGYQGIYAASGRLP
ncbi:MAG: class I SAM-dependent methyltransferase [Bacteroidota bacterium]